MLYRFVVLPKKIKLNYIQTEILLHLNIFPKFLSIQTFWQFHFLIIFSIEIQRNACI